VSTIAARSSWLGLLPFLAAVMAVAVLAGISASSVESTYAALEQPAFAPPDWVFGPVWTVLYVMIGVAGWLLWREAGWTPLLTLWVVQLLLNLVWTPLFFGAGLRGVALADIALLDVAVGALVVGAWRVSRPAAGLLVPYLVWTCFATALNAAIWRLN
jgi:tryptophan-rich sensory protein